MPELPFPYHPIRHAHRLVVGRKAQLNGREVEQLRFRQVNVKEAFTLLDPDGKFFRAALHSMGDKGGEALVYEEMARSPEPPIELTLVCAVLARQRMLLVAQKATELGVTRVLPVFTEHSVGPEGLEHEKAHAWPGSALRAAKQSRRASVPEVRPSAPLAEILAGQVWQEAAARFFLDDRSDRPVRMLRGPKSVCVAVGPEGGWTDEERRLLEELGALPMALGGRVLRSETAVIVGLALVQHRFGDLTT
jgi:16S rRNA (uracil1498-N3)-methyltransferase